MREEAPSLTPTLSLGEGEGALSIPSPPKGERVRVRGSAGRGKRLHEKSGLKALEKAEGSVSEGHANRVNGVVVNFLELELG